MAGDLFYADTVLSLHFDGANNSTVFNDSSANPKTVTASGNAKISTAQSRFGGASGNFNGSGGRITIPYSTAFDFGSGNFTIEFCIYRTGADPDYGRIWSPDGDFFDGIEISIEPSGDLVTVGRSSGTSSNIWSVGGITITSSTWTHIALVRNGDDFTLYKDGIGTHLATTSVALYSNSAHNRVIGAQPGSPSRNFIGYLDEFRIIKGVARYTANFTPPTAPFPDYQSQIIGTITESLAADKFIARAYDIETGAQVGEKSTTTNSFTIDIKTAAKACEVKVSPDYKIWRPATAYAINDNVFPTDPITTPYYYKRLAAGSSGATEPAWVTTPGAQVDDGAQTNAWELVERLIQPVTHGPLIPS